MITKGDFQNWKQDEVTIHLFSTLIEIKEQLTKDMLDPGLIMREGSEKRQAHFLGQKEMIDLILNIEVEDVEEIDSEKDDTSGT